MHSNNPVKQKSVTSTSYANVYIYIKICIASIQRNTVSIQILVSALTKELVSAGT